MTDRELDIILYKSIYDELIQKQDHYYVSDQIILAEAKLKEIMTSEEYVYWKLEQK